MINHFYKETISLNTAEFIQEKSPISKFKDFSVIKERMSAHFVTACRCLKILGPQFLLFF